MARVSVAVVSWNTRELLERCLKSLAPHVASGLAEVCVVDNGSSDGSPEAARGLAPWATVLEPGCNLGFGAAVNLAAARTASEWLLVLNADVALEPGALEMLLAAGDEPTVGCIAPRLLLPDGETQHSVHPFPTTRLTLAFNVGLHHLISGLGDRLCLEGFWDPERARAVPWALGACLLVRRSAFEQVAGFDERLWMYAEDLDFEWRLAASAWRTRYEPRARVLHQSGAATEIAFGDDRAPRFMAESYALLLRRRGIVRTGLTIAVNIVGAAARVAVSLPLFWTSSIRRRRSAEHRRWLRAHLVALRRLVAGATGLPCAR